MQSGIGVHELTRQEGLSMPEEASKAYSPCQFQLGNTWRGLEHTLQDQPPTLGRGIEGSL